jgi:hypothetical protein
MFNLLSCCACVCYISIIAVITELSLLPHSSVCYQEEIMTRSAFIVMETACTIKLIYYIFFCMLQNASKVHKLVLNIFQLVSIIFLVIICSDQNTVQVY